MYIEKIEIQFFRSIYRETISGLQLLNIFTGKNDVGKSNILKALNLFFNNEADPGIPFYFLDNFNFQRLKECQDSIKGKQFIQIKVTFIRGARSEKTLPASFTITKKWFRTDSVPSIVTDDLAKRLPQEGKPYTDRSKSSLTAFLNKMRYIYTFLQSRMRILSRKSSLCCGKQFIMIDYLKTNNLAAQWISYQKESQ